MENRNSKPENYNNAQNQIDSPINTKDAGNNEENRSLTNDESADTDPNQVSDKASFEDTEENENTNDRGRFDGNIGI
jgi:hypothetical protein